MLWKVDFLLMGEDDAVCAFLESILELDYMSERFKPLKVAACTH